MAVNVGNAALSTKEREFKKTMEKAIALIPGSKPNNLRDHIIHLCREYDYDPIRSMIELRQDLQNKLPESRRMDNGHYGEELRSVVTLDREIAKYVFPIMRAIDIQAEIKGNVSINVVKFGEEAEAKPIVEMVEAAAFDKDGLELKAHCQSAGNDGNTVLDIKQRLEKPGVTYSEPHAEALKNKARQEEQQEEEDEPPQKPKKKRKKETRPRNLSDAERDRRRIQCKENSPNKKIREKALALRARREGITIEQVKENILQRREEKLRKKNKSRRK